MEIVYIHILYIFKEFETLQTKEISSFKTYSLCSELLGTQLGYKLKISLEKLYNVNKMYVSVYTSIIGVYEQE